MALQAEFSAFQDFTKSPGLDSALEIILRPLRHTSSAEKADLPASLVSNNVEKRWLPSSLVSPVPSRHGALAPPEGQQLLPRSFRSREAPRLSCC